MATNLRGDLEYHIRTVIGYLIIVAGIIGSLWLMWWLSAYGDIVEIIHDIKMSLPGWVWAMLKYGLSIAFGLVLMTIFIVIGVIVLATGGREQGGDRRRSA